MVTTMLRKTNMKTFNMKQDPFVQGKTKRARNRSLIMRIYEEMYFVLYIVFSLTWNNENVFFFYGLSDIQLSHSDTSWLVSVRIYVCVCVVWVPVIGCIMSHLPLWHKGDCLIRKEGEPATLKDIWRRSIYVNYFN